MGEAGHCFHHPGRETNVSCSECGRPICPDCMTFAAVGIKCPDCARLPRSAIVRLKPGVAARSIAAALAGGAAMGAAFLALVQVGLFFALLLGYLVGLGMAELVLRASGRYRGAETGWIAVGGCLVAYAVPVAFYGPGPFTLIGAAFAGWIAYRQVQ